MSCGVVLLFTDYVQAINARCPDFLKHPGRTVMTEFGKSLVLKTAGVVSRVEDKLVPGDLSLPVTAIVHAGRVSGAGEGGGGYGLCSTRCTTIIHKHIYI